MKGIFAVIFVAERPSRCARRSLHTCRRHSSLIIPHKHVLFTSTTQLCSNCTAQFLSKISLLNSCSNFRCDAVVFVAWRPSQCAQRSAHTCRRHFSFIISFHLRVRLICVVILLPSSCSNFYQQREVFVARCPRPSMHSKTSSQLQKRFFFHGLATREGILLVRKGILLT